MTLVWAAKATVPLGAALLALQLMRRGSAALRFATLAAAMAGLLALPLVEILLPRWGVASIAATVVTTFSEPTMAIATAPREPRDWVQMIWMAGVLFALLRAGLGHALSLWREPLVPMTVGVFRPRVVLPASASRWSDELLRSVQLHEQAHISRRDPLWNLLTQVTRAVYWFHPLVWLAARQLHVERERACDDAVLAAGVRPSDYATHLMICAQSAIGKPAPLAGLTMAGHSHLSTRVEAVLSTATARGPSSRRQRALLAAAGCGLLCPLAAFGSPSIHQLRSLPMYRKLFVPLLAAASTAQAAEVYGRVYDASNATVPKAAVVLRDQSTAAEFKATSGPAGEYKLEGLPAGNYEMEVSMPGFARHQRRGIRLAQSSSTAVSAILKLGEVQETVEVTAQGQARPQQRPPQRVQVGGFVSPMRLLKQVKAAYPEAARAEGREGNVTLRAVVGVDGTIVNVTVLPGADADLASAAEQAVRQWVYQPTMLNGKAMETVTTVEVNFRLGA